jgi:hypothetical protein
MQETTTTTTAVSRFAFFSIAKLFVCDFLVGFVDYTDSAVLEGEFAQFPNNNTDSIQWFLLTRMC